MAIDLPKVIERVNGGSRIPIQMDPIPKSKLIKNKISC